MTGSEKIELLRSVKAELEKNSAKNQKKANGMTAKQRITQLFDEGTFIETGALVRKNTQSMEDVVKASTEGVITGYGSVNGRLTFVYAQDSGVLNGAVSTMHAQKILKVMELAKKAGAALVGIVDCGGGLLEEGIDLLDSYGKLIGKAMEIKNAVPHISIVTGYCTGVSAVLAQISDFVIMSEKSAKLYMQAGQTFGIVSEEYGSAKACLKNGLTHLTAADDEEAMSLAKKLMDYLPDNTLSDAPEVECTDDLNRSSQKLNDLLLQEEYDVKEVIREVADGSQMLELKAEYAASAVTALVRINGRTVGIAANQPVVHGGALCADAMKKLAEFVEVCDGFNIPVVTFVNTPGYAFEAKGTKEIIDAIIDLDATYKNALVPKITVVAGKAYGSAYLTMGSTQLGADLAFALPGAEISVINPAGGADIFFSSQIAGGKDPYKARKEAEEKFSDVYSNPYIAAARGMVDDVIEPDTLRPVLASALEMLYSKIEMES